MSSIPMRRVADIDIDKHPGDFEIVAPNEFNKGDIDFICPRGRVCGVGIRNGQFQGDPGKLKRWGFNGDYARPTLTPSINCNGPSGCGWHGHIRDGEMVDA